MPIYSVFVFGYILDCYRQFWYGLSNSTRLLDMGVHRASNTDSCCSGGHTIVRAVLQFSVYNSILCIIYANNFDHYIVLLHIYVRENLHCFYLKSSGSTLESSFFPTDCRRVPKKKRVGPKRAGTWLTEEAEAILPFILTYFVDIQLGHSNAYCSIQPYETSLAAMVVVGGDCSKTQTPSLLFLRSRHASSLICSGNCNFCCRC
jgi:hypothetical protein